MPNLEEEKLVVEIHKNWTCTARWKSPLSNTEYSQWLSPDAKWMVGIHEYDNEIFAVQDMVTGKMGIPIRDVLRVMGEE